MAPQATIPLPQGALGLAFKDEDVPVVIDVSDNSPLRSIVEPGYKFVSLTLGSGKVYEKMTSLELVEILADGIADSRRKLKLEMIRSSPGTVTQLGNGFVEVVLPETEIGIAFAGKPATIQATKPNSPLAGLGLEGGVVTEIKGRQVFHGLDAAELADVLEDTAGISGRKLVVRLATDDYGGDDQLQYSNSGDSGDGLQDPEGDLQDQLDEPQEESGEPEDDLQDPWDEPQEESGEPEDDLLDPWNESADDAGIPEDTTPFENDEGHIDVELPQGKLGVAFSGSQAVLTKIHSGSPLEGFVNVGMKVYSLTLPDGTQYLDMSTMELVNALKSSASQDGRILTFLPDTGSTGDDGSEKSFIDIDLPVAGKLGVSFKGRNPPASIHKMQDDSPLPQKIKGMSVDTLNVEGEEHKQLNAKQVTDIIKRTTGTPGRVMRVRNPSSMNFKTVTDEFKITIEPGPLGVTFGRESPTIIKAFKEGSQLGGKVPPGVYLDRIEAADGYMQSGMTTLEAVSLLGFLNDTTRTLVFRSNTLEPTPKSTVFPEKIVLELPAGKLGCSFRGSKIAKFSRLHKDSKLKGKVYINMKIESIEIPGSPIFTGLSAFEAAKLLADTKATKGRILTAVAPTSDGVSTVGGKSRRF